MAYKLFPHTYDGDQLRLIFDEFDEKEAFLRGLTQLRERVERNQPRGATITDFKFATTLEHEVIKENLEAVKRIVGLLVLNALEKESTFIVPLPAPQQ
jgi:hypothetical protein